MEDSDERDVSAPEVQEPEVPETRLVIGVDYGTTYTGKFYVIEAKLPTLTKVNRHCFRYALRE